MNKGSTGPLAKNKENVLPRASTSAHQNNNKKPDSAAPLVPDCSICMETIDVQGCLDCCDHAFCVSCISNWANMSNSCPICRKRYSQITKKTASTTQLPTNNNKLKSPPVSASLAADTSPQPTVTTRAALRTLAVNNRNTINVPQRDFRPDEDEEVNYGVIERLINEDFEEAAANTRALRRLRRNDDDDDDDQEEELDDEEDADENGNLAGFVVSNEDISFDGSVSSSTRGGNTIDEQDDEDEFDFEQQETPKRGTAAKRRQIQPISIDDDDTDGEQRRKSLCSVSSSPAATPQRINNRKRKRNTNSSSSNNSRQDLACLIPPIPFDDEDFRLSQHVSQEYEEEEEEEIANEDSDDDDDNTVHTVADRHKHKKQRVQAQQQAEEIIDDDEEETEKSKAIQHSHTASASTSSSSSYSSPQQQSKAQFNVLAQNYQKSKLNNGSNKSPSLVNRTRQPSLPATASTSSSRKRPVIIDDDNDDDDVAITKGAFYESDGDCTEILDENHVEHVISLL